MTASLSKQLKFRRITAGLSRQKLADLSGLSDCTIKFIETGRTNPKASTLLLAAEDPGAWPSSSPTFQLTWQCKYSHSFERRMESLSGDLFLLACGTNSGVYAGGNNGPHTTSMDVVFTQRRSR